MPQEKSQVEKQMKRLNAVREEIATIKETKTRLSGELDGYTKRLDEMKKECKSKFGVTVSKLPDKIKEMQGEIDDVLNEAEELLKGKSDE